MHMERHGIDDDRAARLAKVRSELADKLMPVRGDMSDDKFARTLNLLAQGLERAEYNATRQAQGAEYERLRHTSPGSV
jgi:hypothetical protein